MTSTTQTPADPNPATGPYSKWPRVGTSRDRRTARRIAIPAGIAAGVAAFIHCVLPLIAA